MKKILLRTIAVLLATSLVVDPVSAASFASPISSHPSSRPLGALNFFQQQAINAFVELARRPLSDTTLARRSQAFVAAFRALPEVLDRPSSRRNIGFTLVAANLGFLIYNGLTQPDFFTFKTIVLGLTVIGTAVGALVWMRPAAYPPPPSVYNGKYGPHPMQKGLWPQYELLAKMEREAPDYLRIHEIRADIGQKGGRDPSDAILFSITLEGENGHRFTINRTVGVMGGISYGVDEPNTWRDEKNPKNSIALAVAFFNKEVKKELKGMNVARLDVIDAKLEELDARFKKEGIGAASSQPEDRPALSYIGSEIAIGVSMMSQVALADALRIGEDIVSNYQYNKHAIESGKAKKPQPIIAPLFYSVLFEGGRHGPTFTLQEMVDMGVISEEGAKEFPEGFDGELAIVPPQETQIGVAAPTWKRSDRIYKNLTEAFKKSLEKHGIDFGPGAESGPESSQAFTIDRKPFKLKQPITFELVQTILKESIASIGDDARYELRQWDFASSEMFFKEIGENGMYYVGPPAAHLVDPKNQSGLLTPEQFVQYKAAILELAQSDDVMSFEDWADEKQFSHWESAKQWLKKLLIMADDFTVSAALKILEYAEYFNAYLQKINQSGTLKRSYDAIATGLALGKMVIHSHRGARSADEVTTAAVAMGTGTGFAKFTQRGKGRESYVHFITTRLSEYAGMDDVHVPYQGAIILDAEGPFQHEWAVRFRARVSSILLEGQRERLTERLKRKDEDVVEDIVWAYRALPVTDRAEVLAWLQLQDTALFSDVFKEINLVSKDMQLPQQDLGLSAEALTKIQNVVKGSAEEFMAVVRATSNELWKYWYGTYHDVSIPGQDAASKGLEETQKLMNGVFTDKVLPRLREGENVLLVGHNDPFAILLLEKLGDLKPGAALPQIPTATPIRIRIDKEGKIQRVDIFQTEAGREDRSIQRDTTDLIQFFKEHGISPKFHFPGQTFGLPSNDTGMGEFTILRHGAATHLTDGILGGSLETELTPIGTQQSASSGKILRILNIHHVLLSPKKRVQSTFKAASATAGQDWQNNLQSVETLEGLTDRNFYNWTGRHKQHLVNALLPEIVRLLFMNNFFLIGANLETVARAVSENWDTLHFQVKALVEAQLAERLRAGKSNLPEDLRREDVELYNLAMETDALPKAVEENQIRNEQLDQAEKAPRRPIIGGNWKMNVVAQSKVNTLISDVAEKLGATPIQSEVVLAPSLANLKGAHETIEALEKAGTIQAGRIQLAAQDVFWLTEGAYTGETSVLQLKEFVEWVIVGHSERRQYFGETDETVNRKAKAVLNAGLKTIICVGERIDEREAGKTFEVLERQVRIALADLTPEQMKNVVIAYEPVWAIGTGITATDEDANLAQRHIRALLLDMFGVQVAAETRIQYGGSMKAGNVEGLLKQANVDGGLIGGASLTAKDFAPIVHFADQKSQTLGIEPIGVAVPPAPTFPKVVVAESMNVKELGIPESDIIDISHLSGEQLNAKLIELNPDVVVVRSKVVITADLMAQMPNLKKIIRGGHGVDNIKGMAYAKAHGIEVISTGGSGKFVTALAMRMIMRVEQGDETTYEKDAADPDLFLTIPEWKEAFDEKAKDFTGDALTERTKKWADVMRPIGQPTINALKGRTIGIIGFGKIGKVLAAVAMKLEMNVLIYSPSLETDSNLRAEAEKKGYHVVSKDEIYRTSDYVALMTGLYDDEEDPRYNKGMINHEVMKALEENKNLKAIVNADRGGLVVEADMLEFLQRRKDVRYIADDTPTLEQLFIMAMHTPHMGASTKKGKKSVAAATKHALLSVFDALGIVIILSSMSTRYWLADFAQKSLRELLQIVVAIAAGGKDLATDVRAGKARGIVVLAKDVIEELIAKGHLLADSLKDLGESGIGVAVPQGAPAIDIRSANAVKEAILKADRIIYSSGPSGDYLEKKFKEWEIFDQIKPNLVIAKAGDPVAAKVASKEYEGLNVIGFQQIPELLFENVRYIGPLPDEIQMYTKWSAAVVTVSKIPKIARRVLEYMTTHPSFESYIRHYGIEPYMAGRAQQIRNLLKTYEKFPALGWETHESEIARAYHALDGPSSDEFVKKYIQIHTISTSELSNVLDAIIDKIQKRMSWERAISELIVKIQSAFGDSIGLPALGWKGHEEIVAHAIFSNTQADAAFRAIEEFHLSPAEVTKTLEAIVAKLEPSQAAPPETSQAMKGIVRYDEIDYAALWERTHKPLLMMVNMDMLTKVKGKTKGNAKIEDVVNDERIKAIIRQIPVVFVTHEGRKPKDVAEREALSTENVVQIINDQFWHGDIPVSYAPSLTNQPGIDDHLSALRPGQASFLPNYREDGRSESGDSSWRRGLAHDVLYRSDGEPRYAGVMQNDFSSAPRDTADEDGSPSTRLLDIPLEAGVAFAGPLLIKEVTSLEPAREIPDDPQVFVLVAGSKLKDKIDLVDRNIQMMREGQELHIGGLMSYVFLQARAKMEGRALNLGGTALSPLIQESQIYMETITQLLREADSKGIKVILPVDHVVGDHKDNPTWVGVTPDENILDDTWLALDDGPKTSAMRAEAIKKAKHIVINGTVGVYETRVIGRALITKHSEGLDSRLNEFNGDPSRPFSGGSDTVFIAASAAKKAGAKAFAGGGDTDAAVRKTQDVYGELEFTYISRGGASTQQFISVPPGQEWSPLVVLRQVAENTRKQLPLKPVAPLNFLRTTVPGVVLGLAAVVAWFGVSNPVLLLAGALIGIYISHFLNESGHMTEAVYSGKAFSVEWSSFIPWLPVGVHVEGGVAARNAAFGPLFGILGGFTFFALGQFAHDPLLLIIGTVVTVVNLFSALPLPGHDGAIMLQSQLAVAGAA